MEYNIVNSESGTNSSAQGSGSGLGGFLTIFLGLFIESFIFTLLDVDVSDVPMFLILVLWIVCSVLFAVIVTKLRNLQEEAVIRKISDRFRCFFEEIKEYDSKT